MSQGHMHRSWPLVALVLVLAMALTSCAAPTPQVVIQTQVVEKAVVQTQVVEKVVEKAVVQTQVVEKEVQVTAVPASSTCATAKDHYKIGFANLTEDIVFTQLVDRA